MNQPNYSSTSDSQNPFLTPDCGWGTNAPKGAKAVFSRIVKDSANVPLFLSQTLVNALRDLGYNNTTAAICEFVDNAIQWEARKVRVYFNESGKRSNKNIDVLVLDNGVGMSPSVLRAVTAFGGSMCYDNRSNIGRYGVGMKAAALSIGPTLEIYSWQELNAFYKMILDIEDIGNDQRNVVILPEPQLMDTLPPEIRSILTSPMSYPKNPNESQDLITDNPEELIDRLGTSGTIVFVPNCDRLTYRTVRSLVDHATKEMARIYRRQLDIGLKLFVNNRSIEPFDPTYRMESAWHNRIPELTEKHSRLFNKWNLDIPIEEGHEVVRQVAVRLFFLPIESWDSLPRKVLKNDLHIFDNFGISFIRNNREVYFGPMSSITGKGSRDPWWRLEVEFPAELDEAFGVAVNKQGVRLKGYVTEIIRKAIKDDLSMVKKQIEKFWSQRAAEDAKPKISEAEQRANYAEALQSTLLPQPNPQSVEDARVLEQNLRALAIGLKREDETNDEAFERIKNSRYITTFKHDEDAAFYRVDFQLGKVILTINTAHPFFEKLYNPLAELAKRSAEPSVLDQDSESDFDITNAASEALISLQLLLLSLARTQSEMEINDDSDGRHAIFDLLRRQWSLNLATQLNFK